MLQFSEWKNAVKIAIQPFFRGEIMKAHATQSYFHGKSLERGISAGVQLIMEARERRIAPKLRIAGRKNEEKKNFLARESLAREIAGSNRENAS